MAAPVRRLDPHELRSSACGLFTCRRVRSAARRLGRPEVRHSLRLVLPDHRPAARNRSATNESRSAIDPCSASDPAVVIMRSWVSMLSLMRIGIPCSGHAPSPPVAPCRGHPRSSASGFSSMTDRSVGRSDRWRRSVACTLHQPPGRVTAGRHRVAKPGHCQFIQLERPDRGRLLRPRRGRTGVNPARRTRRRRLYVGTRDMPWRHLRCM